MEHDEEGYTWARQGQGSIIPIVGARVVDQLKDNMGCLDITLSEEQMNKLNDVSKVDLGFPREFLERGRRGGKKKAAAKKDS